MKKIAVVLIALSTILLWKSNTYAQVGVSITVAPPEIPVYAQPACPYDGWIWTPGYWAYDPIDGYYWVPGAWAAPPTVGFLWTPGYWGFAGGYYGWHAGYWGPHIGFYGGVNYGYGYGGVGYYGGRWEGGHFRYNTAVSHVNGAVIHNTYVDRTVIHNGGSHVSFNGPGGISARPTAGEQAAARDRHVQATSRQRAHEAAARKNPNERYSVNKGHPVSHSAARPAAAHSNNIHRSNASHSVPHQNTPRPQQHATPQQHQASRPQSEPRMQQHAAPAQRPQQRMQSRPAPQRAPAGGNRGEGGGERRR